MPTGQLTDQLRQRLVGLLADDQPDGARLLARLRELRGLESASTFSAFLHLLAHLNLPEEEAEHLLVELLDHRQTLEFSLGRDPGLRVAAIDFLSNVQPLLNHPTIVELSQLERTERSAITDDLTGLYNRRYFQSSLDIEIRRSRRYSLALALLMLDLDSFKSVNDLYGHPFGDLVLQLVGQVLRRAVRESDLACRVGGDEFAVILPETDRLGAFSVADRIRREIESHFMEQPIGGRAVVMTLSGGIASYPQDGTDPAALAKSSDQALYHSKAHGRNRITLFHSERRSSIRYPVRRHTRARLSGKGQAVPRDADAIDLSLGGALVEVADAFLPAEPVTLTLQGEGSPAARERWEVNGRVVRVQPGEDGKTHRVAIAFERPLPNRCLAHQIDPAILTRTEEGDSA
jgi:diguanylate cyclase (GGDEF)-like protein